MKTTKKIEYSASAKAIYSDEVKSLNDKLGKALLNAPREREVMRLANAEVSAMKKANPDMEKDEIKKASQRAVAKYRQEVGAVARRDRNIDITDREWEAIQAGAVSESTLTKILNNTDIDKLRERATPRSYTNLSSAQVSRAKAMASSNYTLNEIATKLGVSPSTVSKYLKGVK
jgi:DNA-binding CsgD family transcriptional regulator